MKIDTDFFKIEHNILPKMGRILISEPFLVDEFFKRSVILLTEHNSNGSVGFILNKPVKINIQDILKDFPEFDARIFLGGPVNTNTVHYLHNKGNLIPDSVEIAKDLFWGGDFEFVKLLILEERLKPEDIMFFVGYSGWEENQLAKELKQNSWIVSEIDPDIILDIDKQNLWKQSLTKLGSKYKLWADFPENPEYN